MDLPLPGLKEPLGLGDVVKAVASRAGIQQKKGCGCAKRQAVFNDALRFVPRDRARLSPTIPAAAGDSLTPDGWAVLARCDRAGMYRKPNGSIVICVIDGEQLRACHTVCCGSCGNCDHAAAQARFEETCQAR